MLATAVATWLTLLSYYGDSQIALAAPFAGIVVVAALTASPRGVLLDGLVVALTVSAVILIVLGQWQLAAMGLLTSVAQFVVVVGVGRALGSWPVRRVPTAVVPLASVPRVALAVVSAGVVASLVRWPGLGLVPVSDFENVLLTAVRTTTWGLALGAIGLLWSYGDRPRSRAETRRRGVLDIEVLFVLTVTVLGVVIAFTRPGGLPAVFPLFLGAAWASFRLCPLVATGYAVLVGALGVIGTVQERGVFAQLDDPRLAAVAAQSFMLTLVAVTLTLALANRDREIAAAGSRAMADAAAGRSWERDLVLGSLAEGVALFDGDGRLVLQNEVGQQLFGGELQGEPGRSRAAVVLGLRGEDGRALPDDYLQQLLASSSTEPSELVVRFAEGRTAQKVLAVRVQRVTDEDSARSLTVVTFRDITERYQHVKDLEAFAGVLAHDLARPLSLIQGWTEMLVGDVDDPVLLTPARVGRDGGKVLAAADSMRNLLDDLMTMTIADQRQLQLESVDLSELCASVSVTAVVAQRPDAVMEIHPHLVVHGDRALLRQLLDNLLANAVKYTAPDTVLTICVTAGPSTPGWLRVLISDNGVGIPLEDRESVFDDFYRSEAHRELKGTGIGLSICRRVVERHNGRIRVAEPRGGAGATIELTLPRTARAQPEPLVGVRQP